MLPFLLASLSFLWWKISDQLSPAGVAEAVMVGGEAVEKLDTCGEDEERQLEEEEN
jgi:hypothetical protein